MEKESDKVLKMVSELYQDERETEAEALIKKHLTIDPDNLELLTKLGIIQARLCKDHQAESSFRSVLAKNSNHENAVCGLGRLLDQSLRTDEAEQLYRRYLKENPLGHCGLEDLCRLLISEGRTNEALILARNQVKKHGASMEASGALWYVLHILEDDLDNQLNDDRENSTIFSRLAENLLEQLELVTQIEKTTSSYDSFRSELEDEKIRLVCEIQTLLDSAQSRRILVPVAFRERLSQHTHVARSSKGDHCQQ